MPGYHYQQAVAYGEWERVLLSAGDLQGAQRVLGEAEALVQRHPIVPQVKATLDLANVYIWLASGNLSTALHWAAMQGLIADVPLNDYR